MIPTAMMKAAVRLGWRVSLIPSSLKPHPDFQLNPRQVRPCSHPWGEPMRGPVRQVRFRLGSARGGSNGGVKVLLVEDDKRISSLVKRGLEAESFTVDVALDGKDGLWLATEGSYDVIVLDIMLPGRNGYQICADLREAGDWTPRHWTQEPTTT